MVRGALAATLLVLGVALVGAGCGSEGHVESASVANGQELFKERCGQCHTLADAGTRGRIGPNLDDAFANARSDKPGQGFDESTIRDVVRGQIAYPVEEPPTGEQGMPAEAELFEGIDNTDEAADAVASYVAAVAGLPVEGGGGGEITATEGAQIFAEAGCGSCHTLAAARSNGTIGPNLDESKPSKQLAIDRVTNGRGQMPPFRDQLSEEQIDAVATFVAQNP